jgi:Stealth protein CR2, conserved region 2/Stealth protein CR4, conserved region 4/Stealth protein CR3, conserved region 3/Stealth protein CR1, conserved region 1
MLEAEKNDRSGSSTPGEPIDAVYLWVDGADPGFARTLSERCGGTSLEAAGPRRFRDNGELRYSLRSLEMNAPWIRKVYLVTNGQVPCWLNTESVEVVPHDALFPDPGDLPTWNSHAIELHLHRIPGLSERFLYFNDDMFLGRPVTPEDLIAPNGAQRLHFDGHGLPADLTISHPLGRACARTQRLLDRLYGHQPVRPWPAHVPRLLDRSLVRRIEALHSDEFRATSAHRFRDGDDFALWVFYPFFLLESPGQRGRHTPVIHRGPGSEYAFFMMQESFPSVLKAFALLADWRPRFFCINDDLDDAPADHPAFAALRGLLDTLFPNPSRFEKETSRERAAA